MPTWSRPEDKTLEQCGVFGGECLIYYVGALEAGLIGVIRHELMYLSNFNELCFAVVPPNHLTRGENDFVLPTCFYRYWYL